jgi:hypothetical protein
MSCGRNCRPAALLPRCVESHLVNVLGESGHDTVLSDELHSGGNLLDESLVVAQVITEERLDTQELIGLEATGLSLGLELLDHGVVDLELVASIIDTVDVAEPGSGDERKTAEVVLAPDLLSDGGHDELRDLARGAKADTGKLVHDGWVGETLHECVAVLVNIDTGNGRQKRLDFLVHHLLNELAVDGVVDDFVDVLESSELTSVAKSRVGTVEKAQLVHFELLDVVDILDDLDTGHASSIPKSSASAAMSVFSVRGVIRSTMELGKAPFSEIQLAISGLASLANETSM